eukprot:TRINITY_DN7583_c0_g1_i1.p1 TRINITY_DN7583_c0_g1~~TRINITY_DN7583_c0_g1_i1.p1  ORF type:complete len:288 (-),score=47.54 TRINITY_DN7583_c0_g1_i1:34-837(-)
MCIRDRSTWAVAVKVVEPFELGEKAIKLLHAANANPNLVKVFDIEKQDGKCKIYMELCEGGDLRSFVRRKFSAPGQKTPPKVPEWAVRTLFDDLINGYKTLVHFSVVHLNIKPQNILLDKGVWKLSDYVTSSRHYDQTRTETKEFSSYYDAPELLEGGTASFASDVWSAGVLMYRYLFGEYPYPARNTQEILKDMKLRKVTLPSRPKVSPELGVLLLKMLEVSPSRRASWTDIANFPWIIEDDIDEGRTDIAAVSYTHLTLPTIYSV